MKRVLTASFIAVIVLVYFFTTPSGGQQSEQELRASVPKIVASWETFDSGKIEPYYAADADLTYFDLTPLKCAHSKRR